MNSYLTRQDLRASGSSLAQLRKAGTLGQLGAYLTSQAMQRAEHMGAFLTSEAFNRAERLGAYFTAQQFQRANAARLSDLGCCGGMGGCTCR